MQQGGSTITQQYVKNALDLTREKSITRKINEAVLSVKLEREMSKQEILEGYLDLLRPGRARRGRRQPGLLRPRRARPKFGVAEAAFLAGLIRPQPGRAEQAPRGGARRRQTALEAMQDEGYITAEQADAADAVPWPSWCRPFGSLKLIDTLRGARDPYYMGTDYVTGYVRSWSGSASASRKSPAVACAPTPRSTTTCRRPPGRR